MAFLADLWLAIIIATIVLWFLSFLAWAILPHHFGDRHKVGDEDGLMEYVRQANIVPGNYMFPYAASSKDQRSKEYGEKYMAGPRGTLNVYSVPNMGKNMLLTILYFFITVFTIAYIVHVACPPGSVVLLLLLSPPSAWFLHVPLLLLGILAIIYRPWLRSTPF